MTETFNVLGFGHVGLRVRDIERSRRFYRDMLAFETVWEYHLESGDLLFMGNHSCIMEFMQAKEPLDDGAIDHLSILVDDIETAVANLRGKGVLFEMEITLDPDLYPYGEKFAIFRGPDGERIQLEQILQSNA